MNMVVHEPTIKKTTNPIVNVMRLMVIITILIMKMNF